MNTDLKSINCRHGIDSRFCSLCTCFSNVSGTDKSGRVRGIGPRQPRSRAKGSPSNSRIGYTFEDNGSVLTLNLDLALGWELHEKTKDGAVKRTWCLSEQVVVDSKFDQPLRISVSMFHRPNWDFPRRKGQRYPPRLSDAEASLVPSLAHTKRITLPQKLLRKVVRFEDGSLAKESSSVVDDPLGGDPVVTLAVGGSELKLKVRLFHSSGIFHPGLPWREGTGGKAQMHRQYLKLKAAPPQVELTQWESPVSYEVQMLLVAKPPTKKPAPVYRDWSRRFFPGGLPSLNKRRR